MLRVCYIALGLTCFLLSACGANTDSKSYLSAKGTVSTSLCGDSYLQAFAPESLAALSWQSRSPLSAATREQKRLPQVRASSETLLKWANHFILFGPGERPHIQNRLPRTHHIKWTESFKGVYENALTLVRAMEVSDVRVETWYADVIELSQKTKHTPQPRIFYLTPAGGSAGKDTFVDAVITLAGGQNINKVSGWHSPSVETLLSYQPDIIIKSFSNTAYYSRSQNLSPVLEKHFSATPTVSIEGKYWPCAGPGLLEATKILNVAIGDWHQTHIHKPKVGNDDA